MTRASVDIFVKLVKANFYRKSREHFDFFLSDPFFFSKVMSVAVHSTCLILYLIYVTLFLLDLYLGHCGDGRTWAYPIYNPRILKTFFVRFYRPYWCRRILLSDTSSSLAELTDTTGLLQPVEFSGYCRQHILYCHTAHLM